MPMIGARQEGVKGFVKGSVRGLSGVLIKPVSGALDLLMKTTEGAHSMVNFQHYDSLKQNLPNNLQKLRIIRPFYGKNFLLKPYDEFESLIFLDFKLIPNNEFASDNFLGACLCTNSIDQQVEIIFTEQRLLIIDAFQKVLLKQIKSQSLYMIELKSPLIIALKEKQMEIEDEILIEITDKK